MGNGEAIYAQLLPDIESDSEESHGKFLGIALRCGNVLGSPSFLIHFNLDSRILISVFHSCFAHFRFFPRSITVKSSVVRHFVAVDVVVPHAEHDAALAGDGGREGHLLSVGAAAKVRQEARLARRQLRQPQVALVADAENPVDRDAEEKGC